MFWFYGCETWGILTPWPGIEQTHTPVLKGEVLTTRPPICHFKFGLFFDKHVLLTFPASSLMISYPFMYQIIIYINGYH